MVAEARRRLARFGDRVDFVVADLGRPFTLPDGAVVDAILSTATFHWILDHEALFRHLAAVIRPGGRLVAQCGGQGNIASVLAVLATVGDGWLGKKEFATPEETVGRLARAGFVDVEAWLQPEPTRFEAGEPFRSFLRTVVLGDHLERLQPSEREPFVAGVAARRAEPEIDYIRLNIVATRG
jgi:trans-aconitate 2-methyltransferase